MSANAASPVGFPRRRILGLLLGTTFLVVMTALPAPEGLGAAAWKTAAVGALMATFWITEAIPIPATALFPVVLFPLLGSADIKQAGAPYANPVIFLFLGGFLLARAVQKWGLHRRIALRIVRTIGFRPAQLVAGFMVATAFLSMWVSNTATAAMMVPIGVSVIQLGGPDGDETPTHFATCMMLGIAYAASIGGIGTLVGTPPNALLAGFFSETFGVEIGFAQWLILGIPTVLVALPLTWWVLVRWVFPLRQRDTARERALLDHVTADLGRPGPGEIVTGTVFVLTALAWISRPKLQILLPGLSDAGIAVSAGLLLFLIPVHPRRMEFALDWKSASELPWGILVLFGGGLSLAGAISRTGLAEWLGLSLGILGALPALALIGAVVVLMIFLTEVTSNTASAAAFLPVLASLAVGSGEHPMLLAAPAVLAASCAFMMPVATPPNAIVFASGYVGIDRMTRAGLVLNVLFAFLIPVLAWTLLGPAFGVDPGVLPAWAGQAAVPR